MDRSQSANKKANRVVHIRKWSKKSPLKNISINRNKALYKKNSNAQIIFQNKINKYVKAISGANDENLNFWRMIIYFFILISLILLKKSKK